MNKPESFNFSSPCVTDQTKYSKISDSQATTAAAITASLPKP